MSERRYLPTLGELIDRLSIVLMKTIFIPEHRNEYHDEALDIIHDVDLIVANGHEIGGHHIYDILVLMLANRVIWENESIARNENGNQTFEQFKIIRSINGVRVAARNKLSDCNRREWKVDMIADDIPPHLGKWDGLFW